MNRPEGRRGIIIVLYNLYHYYQIQANATFYYSWAMIEKISSDCVISDYSSTSWLLDQGTSELRNTVSVRIPVGRKLSRSNPKNARQPCPLTCKTYGNEEYMSHCLEPRTRVWAVTRHSMTRELKNPFCCQVSYDNGADQDSHS